MVNNSGICRFLTILFPFAGFCAEICDLRGEIDAYNSTKFLPRLSGKCGEAQAGTPAPRLSFVI